MNCYRMSKFSKEMYEEAHRRLDAIFENGVFEDASVCFKVCKGQCCSMTGEDGKQDVTAPWHIPSMVWDEHLHYSDKENTISGVHLVCLRKDKPACSNKPLICKLHPYYPTKIALRIEECDFGISISTKRRHCFDIKMKPETFEKLSDFYKWLYGEFFDNRLAYVLSELETVVAEEDYKNVIDLLLNGSVVGSPIK